MALPFPFYFAILFIALWKGDLMSKRRRKRRRGIPRGYVYIAGFIIAVVLLVGLVINIVKYTPTKEHLDLAQYFSYKKDNETVVIKDGEYLESPAEAAYAINDGEHVYFELGFVKENLDDGYVYDSSEITLRYATDTQIYTTVVGSGDYTIDKSNESLGYTVLLAQDDTVYIAADYMKLVTDFQYTLYSDPSRVVVETPGFEKQIAKAKSKTQIRKLNGPKSPVVEDVTKGESISVIRDTGKWSFVVSENGVLGYIRNNKLSDKKDVVVEASLEERTYNHISIGNDISMAWQQVTSTAANADIASTLASIGSIDVISPTWFYLNDNKGGIASIASSSYVNYCHDNNIQVWGLVSNLEDSSVDTTLVLNTTSSRDNLVNNLIAQAITYGLDGINVDIEQLSGNASDGFIQFIRELSIKCEKNDIILSVDNYVPTAASECYKRSEQAKYADYVVIMGYDEHYAGSEEAGSVASIGWVDEGVKNTIAEVPAEQVILGIPFYCRVWETDSEGELSSKAYGLNGVQSFLNSHNVTPSWDEASGQYFAEFIEGSTTYSVWVEDPSSIEEKLKVIDKYQIAGGAYWKLGFDNDAVWNTIAKYL